MVSPKWPRRDVLGAPFRKKMDDEASLFDALFSGDASAKEYCTALIEVGAQQRSNLAHSIILATRPTVTAAAGIEQRDGIFTLVNEAMLSAFNERKNEARVDFHAANQAKLEARLEDALRGTQQLAQQSASSTADTPLLEVRIVPPRRATSPAPGASPSGGTAGQGGNFETARVALARMATTHGLVATALLQGLRAALLRQAAEGSAAHVQWTLSKAHLINGGVAYVDDAVSLLRTCGYEVVVRPDALEAGESRDNVCWAMRSCWWSRSQLRGLGTAVRLDTDVAPAGRLSTITVTAGAAPVTAPSGGQATAAAAAALRPEPMFELRAEESWSWCAVL